MQPLLRNLLLCSAVLMPCAGAQAPEGFHWINFKRETETVSRVSQALRAEEYTAIREIGMLADSALVFTTMREPESETPEGDAWSVYNVSMADLKVRKLVGGYDLRLVEWLKFIAAADSDLAITYLSCHDCEPATLFTAFHHDRKDGWRIRWLAKDPDGVSGIPLLYSDVGVPYTDDIVDQVWAVMTPSSGPGRRLRISSQHNSVGRSIRMPKPKVRTESYRESLLDSLRNPDEAAQYLNASLEDKDARVFLLALRDVADAMGGIRALSREARLNRESLYRMLSKSGNPSLESLAAVLSACGLRLAVQSTAPRRGKPRVA